MDDLLKILKDVNPNIDYKNCDKLIDEHYLNSLEILSLIAEIEEEFNIIIPSVQIIPYNFNSMQNIYALIKEIQNEE